VTGRQPPAVRWRAAGDWNAFFGLALDNMTQLVILSGLLIGVFRFPSDLVLHVIVPGTAAGVLAGDLAYTWLAVRLMRRSGRADVTAMPFGIDTPSLFGVVFGVLGPAMALTGDPVRAWKIGMGVTVAMGLFKLVLAFGGNWARRAIPRAALLGSIAGVATLLIAFLPALKVFADPVVGLVSLVLVLVTLVGRVRLPLGVPGALVAAGAGATIFWGRALLGGETAAAEAAAIPGLRLAVPWPTLAWLDAVGDVASYLPIALPFALATVIGGIDNTESAVAAGDEYSTRDVLLTEALATMLAGACGGVIQNTPYVGHPAYKAMGARAGYTLATGLVIGGGAALGVIAVLVRLLPEAAVAPILIFIGLEITAQAFVASPRRHAAAVAVAFLPAVAALALIQGNMLLSAAGRSAADLVGEGKAGFQALLILGNGFVVTALVWAAGLVWIIERRLAAAAAVFAVGSLAALCGAIHSPLPSGALFWPWAPPGGAPASLAAGYGLVAAVLLALSLWVDKSGRAGEPEASAG
jgi:AGZA family xanthine/uracil permease-like MFS transporter